ncbi:MAG: hypothetical protein HGA85_02670 [Nanoarchaeota archaeon]|nr:hypothetical protein [Nanoarchaeota archaeon]
MITAYVDMQEEKVWDFMLDLGQNQKFREIPKVRYDYPNKEISISEEVLVFGTLLEQRLSGGDYDKIHELMSQFRLYTEVTDSRFGKVVWIERYEGNDVDIPRVLVPTMKQVLFVNGFYTDTEERFLPDYNGSETALPWFRIVDRPVSGISSETLKDKIKSFIPHAVEELKNMEDTEAVERTAAKKNFQTSQTNLSGGITFNIYHGEIKPYIAPNLLR